MTEQKKEKPSQWWEFYLVRYLLGTMVGSFISFLLFEHFSGFLSEKLKGILDLTKTYNQLFFLGVGFVFCYISSAPILVMHACRLRKKSDNIQSVTLLFLFLLVLIILISTLMICFTSPKWILDHHTNENIEKTTLHNNNVKNE